ncbi:MAG TPA: type VI secretion system protein TssA [Syntrophobacteraceae bacterium]|nr:type VI secretion system protein TssA [Syntrophobacteraceae bacterium]
MPAIQLESLLKEISPRHPSGEHDLEHDPVFMELELDIQGTSPVEVQGKIVQEGKDPNWSECAEKALELLGRAHDLRVAVLLTRALLNTDGLQGLHYGLKLICGYLEHFWETVYPQLDPDEDNDPTERVNILESLSDWGLVIAPLMKVQLCFSRAAGSVTLRHYRIASAKTSELTLSPEEVSAPPTLPSIEGAFADSSLESIQSTFHEASGALAEAKRLELFMNRKVGSDRAPDLKRLIRVLAEIEGLVQEYLFKRAPLVSATVEKPGKEPLSPEKYERTTTTSVRSFDMIEKREDVLELLEQICAYYELFEPASPVPLLLKRAMRLVTMNFLEILEDMAPESLAQIRTICGTPEGPET